MKEPWINVRHLVSSEGRLLLTEKGAIFAGTFLQTFDSLLQMDSGQGCGAATSRRHKQAALHWWKFSFEESFSKFQAILECILKLSNAMDIFLRGIKSNVMNRSADFHGQNLCSELFIYVWSIWIRSGLLSQQNEIMEANSAPTRRCSLSCLKEAGFKGGRRGSILPTTSTCLANMYATVISLLLCKCFSVQPSSV